MNKRFLCAIAVTFIPSLALPTQANANSEQHASSSGTEFRVSAVIRPQNRLTLLSQLSALVVSEVDIKRGYIEVQAATKISVKSNNRAGYLILFEGLSWPFKEVTVYGLEREVSINSPCAFVQQPYARGGAIFELSYRLVFFENARPGTFPWPLSISLQ